MDEAIGKRPGWTKEQFAKKVPRWSFNVATAILKALRRCELIRTEASLAESENCSVPELKCRVLERLEADATAAAQYFERKCDQETLSTIDDALHDLVFEQALKPRGKPKREADGKWRVGGVAMYYDAESAHAIAATIARILDNHQLIAGPQETAMQRVTSALGDYLATGKTTPNKGFSRCFRDACESALRGTRGRFDAQTRKNMRRALIEPFVPRKTND
jgi:hypothetical protein